MSNKTEATISQYKALSTDLKTNANQFTQLPKNEIRDVTAFGLTGLSAINPTTVHKLATPQRIVIGVHNEPEPIPEITEKLALKISPSLHKLIKAGTTLRGTTMKAEVTAVLEAHYLPKAHTAIGVHNEPGPIIKRELTKNLAVEIPRPLHTLIKSGCYFRRTTMNAEIPAVLEAHYRPKAS